MSDSSANSTWNSTTELPFPVFYSENITLLDQDAIVNVTREYPFEYATIMFGYMMPFVLVITLITNTLVVMVLAQKHMRTPTNIVLFTMAIVDLMTLLSPSPWYFYIYTLGYHEQYLYPPRACYAHHIMTDVIPIFFHTASIWLALLLASQRYIYVCHPTLARTWCTVPRVKKAIIIILVIAFLHQLTKFFDCIFVTIAIKNPQGITQLACKIEIADWVHSLHVPSYFITYYTFRILFVFTIPCIALITLNCLLFRALKRAENKRTELLRTKFKLIGGPQRNIIGNKKASNFITTNDDHQDDLEALNDLASTCSRRTWNSIAKSVPQVSAKSETSQSRKSSNNSAQMKCNLGTADILDFTEDKENKLEPKKSDGSNDTFSLTTTHSNQYEHLKHLDGQQGFNFNEKESIDESNKEEEEEQEEEHSNCLECTACEQNEELDCQKCLMATTDGATSVKEEHHHHHGHQQKEQHLPLHKANSQSSSFLGYATNTGTNEDASSCIITQNASSSIYVANDETFVGTECGEEEGRSLSRDGGSPTHINTCKGHDNKEKSLLAKSSSIDSHLNCSCIATGSRLLQMTGRSTASQKGDCRDCYLDNSCSRTGNKSFVNKSSTNKDWRCVSSCSNSDPYINCNTRKESNSIKLIKGRRSDTRRNYKKAPFTTSHSDDHGNDSSKDNNKHSIVDIYYNENTNTTNNTATTTTTTTTLYSTKTNSIGSLLQVHNQGSYKRRNSQSSQKIQSARFQRPSITTSTSRRDSRGTPRESLNYPTPLGLATIGGANRGGGLVTTVSATMKTMDSNRTTLMLIVVVSVFLMVEVPVAIVTILHVVYNSFEMFKDVEYNTTQTLNYIKLFTNFFIIISYSVNFTIYCSMSKKFRETFRDLFPCSRYTKRKRSKRSHRERERERQQQQQQQHQKQYNQHSFNSQLDKDLLGNATLVGINQNDLTTTISGSNQNPTTLTKFSPRQDSQAECEL